MKATFTVGAVATPPPPTPKLSGSIVGSKATLNGIAGLAPGKATVVVADKSKTDGFVLKGPGVSKATGAAFSGKVTWHVTLKAGKYVYGSLKRPSKRLSFLVSG